MSVSSALELCIPASLGHALLYSLNALHITGTRRLQSMATHDAGTRVQTLEQAWLCRGLLWVLKCLLDIVYGVEYMHYNGVLHGDLKCANVLCKSCSTDIRGFICKVACMHSKGRQSRAFRAYWINCFSACHGLDADEMSAQHQKHCL